MSGCNYKEGGGGGGGSELSRHPPGEPEKESGELDSKSLYYENLNLQRENEELMQKLSLFLQLLFDKERLVSVARRLGAYVPPEKM